MHCSENLGIYRNSRSFRVNDKAQSLMSDKTSCCAHAVHAPESTSGLWVLKGPRRQGIGMYRC